MRLRLGLICGFAFGVVCPSAFCAKIDLRIPLTPIDPVPGGNTVLSDVNVSLRPVTTRTKPFGAIMVDLQDSVQIKVEAVLETTDIIDVTTSTGTNLISSSTNVVSVSTLGFVIPVGTGDADVFADYLGESGASFISIRLGASIVSLEPVYNLLQRDESDAGTPFSHSVILNPGISTQLDVFATLSTGEQGLVTANTSTHYQSLDPGVASVDANGIVRGISIGTARIQATSHSVSTIGVVQVLLPDTTPPVTTLSFIGQQFTTSTGQLFISTLTTINLVAVDPATPNSFTSGVQFTGFALDRTASSLDN